MKLWRIWYKVGAEEDFTEHEAVTEDAARDWFRYNFPYDQVTDIEEATFPLL